MISKYYTQKSKEYKPFKGDSQAHLIYRMERDIVGWAVNTHTKKADLQTVADHACRKYYKVDPPEIKIVRRKGAPFGWAIHSTIYLNALWHGDNMAVLLHELAHHILEDEVDIEDHGPEFVSIYIDLLDKYKMMPRECMELLCTKYGVSHV